MNATELFDKVNAAAVSFGMRRKESETGKGNAVVRRNIEPLAFQDGAEEAYFGYISAEEGFSGPYSDLSLVVFPQQSSGPCVVTLIVGSSGFTNDYPLAQLPGLRRSFLRLLSHDSRSFCKTTFTDTDSPCLSLPEIGKEEDDPYRHLRNQIRKYETVILASRILDPDETKDLDMLKAWLATYAYYRDWARSREEVKAVSQAISTCVRQPQTDELSEIMGLLEQRHFVVLQGAPGTGKTYHALCMARQFDQVFFEQFHAETTYADFVYGLKPSLDSETLRYEPNEGILYRAIRHALEHDTQRVLLIIDEINRANLAHVLGPVFYLFEYQAHETERPASVRVGDLTLRQLPRNLRVLATMNTADRSLAVVDFALRRRFAWYTLVPHAIEVSEPQMFHKQAFDDVSRLFDKYASDEELNLQPGPFYFITQGPDHEVEFRERVLYELMPLMKEYFTEGLLVKARDEFGKLFFSLTGRQLYL